MDIEQETERAKAYIHSLVERACEEPYPDPYDLIGHVNGRALESALHDYPGSEIVAHVFPAIEYVEVPPWEPEFAEKLEDFLYQELDEEAGEKRMEELKNGADLTLAESAEYERNYWEWESYCQLPICYIYRLPLILPDGSSHPVYFITENREMGQMSDLVNAAGPFRTLNEVARALKNDERTTLDTRYYLMEFNLWDKEVEQELLHEYSKSAEIAGSGEEPKTDSEESIPSGE